MSVENKTCFRCKGVFALSEVMFFRSRATKDGYHSWCKACCSKANKAATAKRYSTFERRIKTFLTSCRNSAARRNQPFELAAEDFELMWKAQSGLCAYSGVPMNLAPNTLETVSVERIDSGLGYTKENTILVCTAVNRMKSDLKATDFYSFCRRVTLWLSDDNLELGVQFVKDT